MSPSLATVLAACSIAVLAGCTGAPAPSPATRTGYPSALPRPGELPRALSAGDIETVAMLYGSMPTGVTVSRAGRIFLSYPRWEDVVQFTVAELIDGMPVPFPDIDINRLDTSTPGRSLVSVQSVVIDPADRLWLLDTGSLNFGPPLPGGPKLVAVDLTTNRVVQTIAFPSDVALRTTYLNDVRFDLRRGTGGTAFITDSANGGPNGIVVVDLASGRSWRALHDHPSTRPEPGFLPFVEGRPLLVRPTPEKATHLQIGSDGIAIGADGRRLFYCALAGRRLYSVSADALADPAASAASVAATVADHGEKGMSDGLESDAQGRIYMTNLEQDAIIRRRPDGLLETVAYDSRLLWPDTLALAPDGFLYFTVNQLHRRAMFNQGRDQRVPPYGLLRLRVDGTPVQLR
jgi:sugar lactone lactonase YvrE